MNYIYYISAVEYYIVPSITRNKFQKRYVYWVKKASCRKICTVWFHLYSFTIGKIIGCLWIYSYEVKNINQGLFITLLRHLPTSQNLEALCFHFAA